MAALFNSPRRALGPRDVNSKLAPSPSKLSKFAEPLRRDSPSADIENSICQLGLKPDISILHSSTSPSKGVKRALDGQDDLRSSSPRKQLISGLPEKTNARANGASVDESESRTIIKTPSSTTHLPRMDLSFDGAQDSILDDSQSSQDDSQDTILTVPDDNAPIPATTIPTTQPARPHLTQQELRDAAARLKARLGLAMHRVRTNQIQTPFDQLALRIHKDGKDVRPRTPSLASQAPVDPALATASIQSQPIPQTTEPATAIDRIAGASRALSHITQNVSEEGREAVQNVMEASSSSSSSDSSLSDGGQEAVREMARVRPLSESSDEPAEGEASVELA